MFQNANSDPDYFVSGYIVAEYFGHDWTPDSVPADAWADAADAASTWTPVAPA